MKNRPTSISVIGWLLIVIGSLSLLSSTVTLNNPTAKELMSRSPLPLSVQYAMMFAGLAVTIISGVAMLRGKNWGRFLYVIWSACGFVIGLLTSPIKISLLPGLLVFLVVCFFLFRPKANEYFSSNVASHAPEST